MKWRVNNLNFIPSIMVEQTIGKQFSFANLETKSPAQKTMPPTRESIRTKITREFKMPKET